MVYHIKVGVRLFKLKRVYVHIIQIFSIEIDCSQAWQTMLCTYKSTTEKEWKKNMCKCFFPKKRQKCRGTHKKIYILYRVRENG